MQWTALKQIYDNKKQSLESMNPLMNNPTISKPKKIIVWLVTIGIIGLISMGMYIGYIKLFKKQKPPINPPLTQEQFTNILLELEKQDAYITPDVRSRLLLTDPSLTPPPETVPVKSIPMKSKNPIKT